jgi:hypothetical protein
VNGTWQDAVVLAVVAATVGAFLWAHRRRKKPRTGCGCGGAASPGPGVSVTYSRRRGEASRVIVRGGGLH